MQSQSTDEQILSQCNEESKEQKVELVEPKETTVVPQKNSDKQPQLTNEQMKKLMQQIKILITVKMLKEDAAPVEVIPNLYIGSLAAALSLVKLNENKIKFILTACDQKKNPFPNDFKYLNINVADTQNQLIIDRFEEGTHFIHNAVNDNQNVLVHCFAGKSRSSSFILAYLIKYHKMKVDDALQLLKSKRTIAQPNPYFMVQLRQYYCQLYPIPQNNLEGQEKSIESQ